MLPRCLKTDTRKRAAVPKAKPKSLPPASCNSVWQRSGVMLFISATVSSAVSTLVSSCRSRPCSRSTGRLADGDVQIAGPLVDDRLQQFVDQHGSHGRSISLSRSPPRLMPRAILEPLPESPTAWVQPERLFAAPLAASSKSPPRTERSALCRRPAIVRSGPPAVANPALATETVQLPHRKPRLARSPTAVELAGLAIRR